MSEEMAILVRYHRWIRTDPNKKGGQRILNVERRCVNCGIRAIQIKIKATIVIDPSTDVGSAALKSLGPFERMVDVWKIDLLDGTTTYHWQMFDCEFEENK